MSVSENPRERRLVLRLLGYWRDLCGDRDMPRPADIDGAAIPDMWDYCFMIDLTGKEPAFTHFGHWHREFYGSDLTGLPVSALTRETLAERSVRYLPEVLQRHIPITYGGSVTEPGGREILYRSILMPLSDDDEHLNAIFGGANCKFADDDGGA